MSALLGAPGILRFPQPGVSGHYSCPACTLGLGFFPLPLLGFLPWPCGFAHTHSHGSAFTRILSGSCGRSLQVPRGSSSLCGTLSCDPCGLLSQILDVGNQWALPGLPSPALQGDLGSHTSGNTVPSFLLSSVRNCHLIDLSSFTCSMWGTKSGRMTRPQLGLEVTRAGLLKNSPEATPHLKSYWGFPLRCVCGVCVVRCEGWYVCLCARG